MGHVHFFLKFGAVGKIVLGCLFILLAACTGGGGGGGEGRVPTPASPGPGVQFVRPDNATTLVMNRRTSVYAIIEDINGVSRADFIVDGVIVETRPLAVYTRRFDYLVQLAARIRPDRIR